jgi:hypothetical protein
MILSVWREREKMGCERKREKKGRERGAEGEGMVSTT